MDKPDSGAQFVRWFGPLLDALRSLGGSGTPDEVVDRIAVNLSLTDEVLNGTLPSGQSRFKNQVAWARFYLVREGLLDSSARGVWSLTERGRSATITPRIAREIFLKWVRFFKEQRDAKSGEAEGLVVTTNGEQIEAPSHRDSLLTVLLKLPSEGFERLSQRLLRESGFAQVSVTGRSGDGGIDGYGTLQLNPFVSFRVLFQCKRYAGSVSPSQVRDFRGAMAGRADKGIIITTGTFTADAKREASRDGVSPIELIDGDNLIKLMEKLQLGLSPVQLTNSMSASLMNFEPRHVREAFGRSGEFAPTFPQTLGVSRKPKLEGWRQSLHIFIYIRIIRCWMGHAT